MIPGVSAGAVWMVAGLVLAGLEMLAPGVFLLWIGLAALGTGVATELLGAGSEAQAGLFVVLTAGLIGGVALRLRRRTAVAGVNAPGDGLIGQTCQALTFSGPEGRVSLGDGTWYARMVGHLGDGVVQPAAGQTLRVVGLDGTVLLVANSIGELR